MVFTLNFRIKSLFPTMNSLMLCKNECNIFKKAILAHIQIKDVSLDSFLLEFLPFF